LILSSLAQFFDVVTFFTFKSFCVVLKYVTMPKPRHTQINLTTTPYYHCVSRCVRRAFLCGFDENSQTSFDHRREWLRTKIFELAEVFAIDVCAYAVMSNHYHLVLHVDQAHCLKWSDEEVILRWHRLTAGTPLTHRAVSSAPISPAESVAIQALASKWRNRLSDISWFMKFLNEWIAKQANQEDGCTGHFWESRFKSQALLDEKALAAAMAYVDLNPIRANMANSPETSDFTSIQDRINSVSEHGSQPNHLLPFTGNPTQLETEGLPYKLIDYLSLVDWSGRSIVEGKRGAIPSDLPPILTRLQISSANWLKLSQQLEARFKTFIGDKHSIDNLQATLSLNRKPHCQSSLFR